MELLGLEDVLREQVEIFSAQSKTHELELTLPPVPLSVVAERGRVGQVVANLLSNAIKYSPAGGRVEVSGEVRDDAVRVTVSDQGLGIPAEQQEKLFTKFFRVDSSDTRSCRLRDGALRVAVGFSWSRMIRPLRRSWPST
jgi:signal transduction histidine kinase